MSENDSCSMAPRVITWRVQFSCLPAVIILYHLDSQRLIIDHAALIMVSSDADLSRPEQHVDIKETTLHSKVKRLLYQLNESS